MSESRRGQRAGSWLKYFLCGSFIGAGTILPGVSGGVLAVIFDVYRPFMEILTRPRQALRQYWRMLPPLGIGWCFGFLAFAKGIVAALEGSAAVTEWLLIGLIAGTVPVLFREAGKTGRTAVSWASLLICGAILFAVLFYVSHAAGGAVTPNFWWYNVCGALWGLSVVIPGITSSSLMMALGLYQPMMEGLARMDLLVLSACLPGMVLAVLLSARFVLRFCFGIFRGITTAKFGFRFSTVIKR